MFWLPVSLSISRAANLSSELQELGGIGYLIFGSRRLAPHLDAMVECLGVVLEGAFVSVKPKRGEGIGAVGRAEGIACWAVALLESR